MWGVRSPSHHKPAKSFGARLGELFGLMFRVNGCSNQSIGATMNDMHAFFRRLCQSPIHRRAAVTLVALAWSSLAFGGEIHDAAKNGDLQKVKALLKDNPELVFSKDNNSRTPLYYAAAKGHKDVVELLLANKVEVNPKSIDGSTPLHEAAMAGHRDVVELLLANKAEVNTKNGNGMTPLDYAETRGRKDVLELLAAHHGSHE